MDVLALDQQLCFALYKASRAVTSVYRPALAELDLTYPQYLVMLALWERDGREVRDLGHELELDTGTLSPLLRRLERRRLVRRERQAADERRVTVRLTATGAALRERAFALPQLLAPRTGLTGEEVAELRSTLDRLTRTVHQAA
ncbi:MarR family winged helix-turn-helix transcriptional regulator [Nocardia asteroides]|uniref:MarR family winged helix-turn-helix transcriptional regulator n=1 Tax=Nocardia asteroides TaxID=1824 RepID=UPI001E6091DC|nr:MarR family winged helix-turn-helix transcriptional regulator [Nocardia asteroides]UGT59852.1 MarR family winged helix-turn-helix transcriptional regulator [Nocardia asteroides]